MHMNREQRLALIAEVQAQTDCSHADALAYLIAEEWNADDAAWSYVADAGRDECSEFYLPRDEGAPARAI
jgi:hypothetical protein